MKPSRSNSNARCDEQAALSSTSQQKKRDEAIASPRFLIGC
ncbi:hypothetical protein RISK_003388 [Rhodopirellula islandica]|uniref:Uncharacterized protein n=1 Tax=Rhodopirellula islandica TaxID=595434 RepID=A0A0J1EFP5_RHOIS|nr:hypothetical protein RISK_003388 [Rhodopirellula islandica]